MFIQQMLNGIVIGSVYALIALGLTMVYGIMRILDIANAAAFTLGAYIGLAAYLRTGSLLAALATGIVAAGVLGFLFYRAVYMPMATSDPVVPLVAAIGLFTALGDLYRLIAGPYTHTFPASLPLHEQYILGAVLTPSQILIVLLMVLLFFGLALMLYRTPLGLAWRATSQDAETAAAMGINVRRVSGVAFMIGYALAAVAGILVGVHYNQVYPSMGEMPSYKMLAIVVLGGLGNPFGAVLASFVIGMAETVVAGYLGSFLPSDAVAFIFLIAILLVRPYGLLGQKEAI